MRSPRRRASPRRGSPRRGGRCRPRTAAAGRGDPTETASSTSAVSSCGVDTETSTPQLSLNSHWFFGWLTRAITRGTANSCLASSEITRLSSSSPVAATTTSTVARPAASREAPRRRRRRPRCTSRSPRDALDEVGVLLDEQDVVAAVVEVLGDGGPDAAGAGDGDLHAAARTASSGDPSSAASPAPRRDARAGGRARPWCDHQVEHVALLADQVGDVEPGDAGPGDRGDQGDLAGHRVSARRLPAHVSGSSRSTSSERRRSGRSTRRRLVGEQPAAHLVDGPRRPWPPSGCRALVDLGPAGVVDPGDDVGDPVGLPGDPRRQDVGVVAAGHRGERAGLARAAHRRGRRGRSPSRRRSSPGQSVGEAAEGLRVGSMIATVWPCRPGRRRGPSRPARSRRRRRAPAPCNTHRRSLHNSPPRSPPSDVRCRSCLRG